MPRKTLPRLLTNLLQKSVGLSLTLSLGASLAGLAAAQNPAQDAQAFRDSFLAGDTSWDEVEARAKTEGEVVWSYWGGSEELNFWVDTVVTPEVTELGVTLRSLRVPDTRDAVDQVIADAATGRGLGAGSSDLIWINGENFFTLDRQALLFGPFADKLPNSAYFYLGKDDPPRPAST